MSTSADRTVDIRARAQGFVRVRSIMFGQRRVVEVDAQGEDLAGALSPSDGHSIAAAARYSREQRLPLLIRLASSGANLQQGVAALDGWGGAAHELTRCSGVVPTMVIVSGPTVSGPALMLGLADIVVMVSDSYAFVSGPAMVKQFTGVPVDGAELGGPDVHERLSGVASFVAADVAEAESIMADVLRFLPDHTDVSPPTQVCSDPVSRPTPEAYEVLPASVNGSYDCREIIRSVVDDGDLLELHTLWAPNLVTGFASMGGRPIGVVANQPQSIAGTLDITASRKGARFVAFCDAFNLPLLTFVDTSGFYPGKDLEWRGMIRYGAQLAFAYARATVGRVNVTTRKSYGGAYIVMDSKTMGNDIALAWPSAEIAVMGAKGAVEILHRRRSAEERVELESAYEERLLNPYIAAERGTIDAVIDPAETRQRVCAAFEMLASKRERLPRRRHDNTPL
ncbi:MAG: methylmalonyl-CoA carboxyltransferase [Acidimicrobiaceae bacterium]|nr:methylmalonyl-CoA carboxyltransferase [Acidimicrobiaceae bacterium]MXW77088.1 methylmalonyl-CoA carboxyltransferase [Acidimicrobiaceae bacterium]MYC41091.1 methylmalonyl-CoA carboxyltransferase [Acidimicrobiaceae bacterium]MYD06871.1 methylmalonyl-CoA carboxyltransferase [Acidimicrobiaceae bacterium]MYI58408.1 methylmalonyl-CoA carboxyltransferase [Acidimicrobiaceae bacterium]